MSSLRHTLFGLGLLLASALLGCQSPEKLFGGKPVDVTYDVEGATLDDEGTPTPDIDAWVLTLSKWQAIDGERLVSLVGSAAMGSSRAKAVQDLRQALDSQATAFRPPGPHPTPKDLVYCVIIQGDRIQTARFNPAPLDQRTQTLTF